MDEAEKVANAIKPPRCPKCGAELGYLDYYEEAWSKSTFQVWNGDPIYDRDDWDTGLIEAEFSCPECGEVLFTSEEEATKFLSGEADA